MSLCDIPFILLGAVLIFTLLSGLIFGRPAQGWLSIIGLVFASMAWLTLLPDALLAASAWGGGSFEADAFHVRAFSGPYVWVYWAFNFLPVLVPQLFWFKRVRSSRWAGLIVTSISLSLWVGFHA